jgi:hypothetical protein
MPVIKLTATGSVLNDADKAAIISQLTKELEEAPTADGPVIFEIPLSGGDKFDVLVVWEKWKENNIPTQTRSEMIMAAYGDKTDKIALPLGVTYQEAMEQNLLPYAVIPMARKNEVPAEQLKASMKKYGAFALPGDKVDLRLPTIELASDIHKKLVDELPKAYWSIAQSLGPIE